jgi:hypothetical protein
MRVGYRQRGAPSTGELLLAADYKPLILPVSWR